MDFDEAAEALAQAVRETHGSPEPDTPNPLLSEQADPTPSPATNEQPPSAETPQAPVEDSFIERADLEALLDGIEDPAARERIERAYKSFQGGFTRKTQELAPWRSLAEQGIDPETAARAAQWYEAMADPQVAQQFYEHLGQTLSGYGLLQQQPTDVPGGFEDEGFEDLLDDPNDPSHPLAQRMNQLEQYIAQAEYQRQAAEEAAAIQHAESAIREANPSFKQADIDRIYALAMAREDFDLTKAADQYNAWRQEMLTEYMESKGSVPTGGHIPATGNAQTPIDASSFIKEDGEIDFERLTRAATAMYEANQQ